ncbi:MAG TPA: hypothetical protein VNZ58_07925 [Thermomicrobiales bacterium]|nr:hypothetical protein [Thermomicrobiales bacterium]
MTTRDTMRTMIRRRLADEGPDPLWDDAFLNDAIAEAVRRYSTHMPRQDVAAIAVQAGEREIEMPEDVNALRIVRVFDDRGALWPRWEGSGEAPPVAHGMPGNATWRVWGNAVLLGAPATRTGLWRFEHLVHRTEPVDDLMPLDIQPNDEDIIVALALAVALSRRAVSEGKRYTGRAGVHPMAAAARSAQVDADRMFWSRTHKARGGSLNPASGL